jgi:hypothetical protein
MPVGVEVRRASDNVLICSISDRLPRLVLTFAASGTGSRSVPELATAGGEPWACMTLQPIVVGSTLQTVVSVSGTTVTWADLPSNTTVICGVR